MPIALLIGGLECAVAVQPHEALMSAGSSSQTQMVVAAGWLMMVLTVQSPFRTQFTPAIPIALAVVCVENAPVILAARQCTLALLQFRSHEVS